jgi:hypothetical protein
MINSTLVDSTSINFPPVQTMFDKTIPHKNFLYQLQGQNWKQNRFY